MPDEVNAQSEVPRRKVLAMEVGAFAALIMLPVLVRWTQPAMPWQSRNPWSNIDHGLSKLALILPLLFILWSSGDGWKRFGIRRFRAFPDLLIAAFLTFLQLGTQYLPKRLQLPGFLPSELRDLIVPTGAAAIITVGLALLIGAAFEELFFRGYLIPRLEELTGNVWVGVVVSSLAFGAGHLYQGYFQAFMTIGMGLAFGIAFVGRRSIGPLILAHAAYNLIVTFPF